MCSNVSNCILTNRVYIHPFLLSSIAWKTRVSGTASMASTNVPAAIHDGTRHPQAERNLKRDGPSPRHGRVVSSYTVGRRAVRIDTVRFHTFPSLLPAPTTSLLRPWEADFPAETLKSKTNNEPWTKADLRQSGRIKGYRSHSFDGGGETETTHVVGLSSQSHRARWRPREALRIVNGRSIVLCRLPWS